MGSRGNEGYRILALREVYWKYMMNFVTKNIIVELELDLATVLK